MRRVLCHLLVVTILFLPLSVGHASTPLLIDFKDAPLHKLMDIFGYLARRDVLYMKGVNPRIRITIRLENVSLEQAITEVLAAVDLVWVVRGEYIYVGPRGSLDSPYS